MRDILRAYLSRRYISGARFLRPRGRDIITHSLSLSVSFLTSFLTPVEGARALFIGLESACNARTGMRFRKKSPCGESYGLAVSPLSFGFDFILQSRVPPSFFLSFRFFRFRRITIKLLPRRCLESKSLLSTEREKGETSFLFTSPALSAGTSARAIRGLSLSLSIS